MTRIGRHLRKLWKDEAGTASVEFVIMFPLIFAMFFASFESGYMVLRSAMLERSLDLTVRDLRLGNLKKPTVEYLQQRLCSRTDMFEDCERSLTIELTRVNTSFNNLPTVDAVCQRRSPEIQAGIQSNTVNTGQENELMVVRACLVVDALFPSAFMGVNTAMADANGTYALLATSAFVNEPN
ncbi:MAG: pilus assembly protein TadE [Rhodobacteraceae bacterium PARR1]|nr:MAG: pilus assembly protein TadE [Rhodobacteraceae bacterium PARR1]